METCVHHSGHDHDGDRFEALPMAVPLQVLAADVTSFPRRAHTHPTVGVQFVVS